MWIIYSLLVCILIVLIWIRREIHVMAFHNSFNLTFFRHIIFEKMLTEAEPRQYQAFMDDASSKYPQYFEQRR